MTIRNLTILVEHTNKQYPVDQVASDVTANELLESLADKIYLPAGTRGILKRKLTRKQILPNQSLEDAGVENNETLLADLIV